MTDGYWRLYCKVFKIKICRRCGVNLKAIDRRRGEHCYQCYLEEQSERYFSSLTKVNS